MTDHFTDPSAPEPTDAQLEAHITGMDIVSDVPGPFIGRNPRETFNWSSTGAPEVTIEAFAPETQQEMRAKLAGLPEGIREQTERELVATEARRLARAARVKTGLGDGAFNYHREMMEIENEQHLINQEAASIREQLERVDGYSAEVGENGEPEARHIFSIRGDQRTALQNRYNQLSYQLQQVQRESEKRLKSALETDKARIREQREALAINAEATKLAQEKLREERVEQLAEGRMKSLRRTGI